MRGAAGGIATGGEGNDLLVVLPDGHAQALSRVVEQHEVQHLVLGVPRRVVEPHHLVGGQGAATGHLDQGQELRHLGHGDQRERKRCCRREETRLAAPGDLARDAEEDEGPERLEDRHRELRAADGDERRRLWERWREIDDNLDVFASRRSGAGVGESSMHSS